MSQTEIPEWINEITVENAWKRMLRVKDTKEGLERLCVPAMRAARARDSKLLLTLDKMSEVMSRMSESQYGSTRRFAEKESERAEITEVAMVREAYICVDKGDPVPELSWVYGAACILCGLIYL